MSISRGVVMFVLLNFDDELRSDQVLLLELKQRVVELVVESHVAGQDDSVLVSIL